MPQDQNTPEDLQPSLGLTGNQTAIVRPRRVWIAILLGLFFGPLAQVYCGRLGRAIALCFVGWIIAIVGFFIGCYLPWGLVAMIVIGILVYGWRLFIPIDAAMIAARSKNMALKGYQRFWAYLLIALGFACLEYGFSFLLRREVVEAFFLPTRSMNLTLLPGDRFLVDKVYYRFAPLRRGDLAAFYMKGPDFEIHSHRVIGLPGDVVEIRDEKLYLNGQLQEEPYAYFWGDKKLVPGTEKLYDFGPETVPEGHFFEMGDNRRRSVDSRLRGCIPIQDIVGKIQVIYWSSGLEQPDDDPEGDRMSPFNPPKSPKRIRWERIGLRFDD